MAFFQSFTDSIKQKWLQFFQVNRDWISLQMEVESVYTPDGGKRPPSFLILGVVNALEPKLAQLMFPFAKLNPDADTLIEVLELNFDPDIALGNRFIPKVETETYEYKSGVIVDDVPEDETLTNDQLPGFEEEGVTQEFTIEDDDQQDLMVSELEETPNELGEISLSNGNNSKDESDASLSLEMGDEFGDISFDAVTDDSATLNEGDMEDEVLADLSTTDVNAFSDVLSDVWGDETSLQKGEENNDFLGEELPSGVFDESEIARLFPNS
ncbi:DUF5331 domain-containing protein [Cylindrospermum sp. FACHB-282]|uniref:DUF5331 domain-containing protein n=1 Tax=Cylindrospermum sp. FACHB-282 TaxID=2692794 RepID=UPI00168735BD|nr:DUF5331 domain-containing protein [Cylindrospermum sp. FACHB-282]MBD2388487.1 DUF5331 domain-containing protein [Cylindrospermum sp. FACHB-282]